jgi:hypothetical protein
MVFTIELVEFGRHTRSKRITHVFAVLCASVIRIWFWFWKAERFGLVLLDARLNTFSKVQHPEVKKGIL